MHHLSRSIVAGGAAAATASFGLIGLAAPTALAATCTDTGVSGVTAALVATAGEHITGPVDASGCDVGVFVGPEANHATIQHATISGANDHGIFVLDASHVTIAHNVVKGNGVAPHSMAEDKAIDLVGTAHSSVIGNLVASNLADGGIALNDDGPFDPALPGGPGNSTNELRASQDNVVKDNTVVDNAIGCGVVVSSYNAGAGVIGNRVVHNTLMSTRNAPAPVIGSVVLAGQFVFNNRVADNTIVGSAMPGIVLHSNTPDEVLIDNVLARNKLSGDDWLEINGPAARVGILLGGSEPGSQATGELSGTRIVANRISDEDIGIYLNLRSSAESLTTRLAGNRFASDVTTPVQNDTP